jgi:endonuclease/exonuclease/phosphatase family metal-dependent hydrolase
VEIVGVELPRTRLALVASDHLPLVADIRLG